MAADVRTSIRFDRELWEKIEAAAKEMRVSKSDIIRMAVLQFLGSLGAPSVAAAEGGEPTVPDRERSGE